MANELTIDQLPQLKSWPDDGGAFVTLPQVYTEDIRDPGLPHANLGMYRVQLSGGQYVPNREVGLHYQLHRGIGVHHAAALDRGAPLPVNIFVGGTPAMTVAAVMPLPEGMSELTFAGALAGHRIPLVCRPGQLPVYAEADFCIQGSIDPTKMLPEGPFGDHLGYYSLQHEFPYLRVERVTCRDDAIWPFTVVGRPPQEDTVFGQLIHELTAPVIPTVIPGVHAVHAVDAAGVHPLMLAIGSERYVPYEPRRQPRELLTQANAILGQGQMSLAKYLWIVDRQDDPALDVRDVPAFFQHVLARVDWRRDLHFQTCTTIDTLDYSGTALNEGSKVIIAAAGPSIRSLPTQVPADLHLPGGFRSPRVCLPGVLAVQGPAYRSAGEEALARFCREQTAGVADQPIPVARDRGRQRVHCPALGQLSLGRIHAQRSGSGHGWHCRLRRPEALGLSRCAGHGRSDQTATCPAADRRIPRCPAEWTPWPRAEVPWRNTCDTSGSPGQPDYDRAGGRAKDSRSDTQHLV